MENGNPDLVEIIEGLPTIIGRETEHPKVPLQHIRELVTPKHYKGSESTLYEVYPVDAPKENLELYLM